MAGKTTLKIGSFLDEILSDFHQKNLLDSDPLGIVHEWENPLDQEVVALISAVLAYGKVAQIRTSIRNVLRVVEKLGETPSSLVQKLSQEEGALHKEFLHLLQPFKHRFNRGVDVFLLFMLMAESTQRFGSVGAHFLSPHLGDSSQSLESRWNAFIREWKTSVKLRKEDLRTFSYFLTAPEDGSSCKRWCMFLRWMVRSDQIDLGVWGENSPLIRRNSVVIRPKDLFMPLDTHTGRISQFLGLTSRKSLNWKTTVEVTDFFRKIAPDDPTKYDFALSRLGILDLCQKTFNVEICSKCKLLPVCQYANLQLKNGPSRAI